MRPSPTALVDNLERNDRLLSTGFVGVALLCPVLTVIGRQDLAFALLHDDRFPSWGYSVRQGATTIWERWDGWTEQDGFGPAAMNSFNHYSLGSIGEWLFADVAGIAQQPGSVAYRNLLVQPHVGGRLSSVRGSYLSPFGTIATGWDLDGGTVRLEVEVPPGSDAVVVLPTERIADVRLDGAEVPAGDATEHAGRPAVRIPSGRFSFTCPASTTAGTDR